MAVEFTLNGAHVSLEIDPQTPLLEALRNDLRLNGAKFGCGLAQCGACAVLLDGVSIRSCVTPVAAIAGKSITTLEGLGNAQHPHPLPSAHIWRDHLIRAIERGEGALDWAVMAREQARASGLNK